MGPKDYSNGEIGGMVNLGGLLVVFLIFYGIPTLFTGLAFNSYTTFWFWRKYYALVDWLILLVNEATFLNLKASKDEWFFPPKALQIFSWLLFVLIAPASYWLCVELRNDAQKAARKEEERLRAEKEREAELAAWRAEEKRKMAIEEKKRQEKEAREQKILERKKKESEDPDPWDSGFL